MQLVWDLLPAFAVIFLWTLAIRVFPRLLGDKWRKSIEHKYAKNLESYRTSLEARYATLSDSVQFLSATRSVWQSRMVESVAAMWKSILKTQEENRDLVFANNIFRASELEEFFGEGLRPGIGELCDDFRTDAEFYRRLREQAESLDEEHRLFSGEKLWLVTSTIRNLHGRLAYLANKSFKESRYFDWRHDEKIKSMLQISSSSSLIEEATERDVGGLCLAIAALKTEFLREAIHVLSGSSALSESLTNLQDTIMTEKNRLDIEELQMSKPRR